MNNNNDFTGTSTATGYSSGTSIEWTNTSYDLVYTVSCYPPNPKPLKEMMKLWAKERMRLPWENEVREKEVPVKFIYDRPVPLRGVRLGGNRWAI